MKTINTVQRIPFNVSSAALFAFIFLPHLVYASAPQYSVLDLGTLGGTRSFGYAVNASGQVAGYSYIEYNTAWHAVRWTGTTPQDLGIVGGPGDSFSINASGQIAGRVSGNAIRWTGTTEEILDSLGGSQSRATSINDAGQVTGFSLLAGDTPQHAVRWTGTAATDLGGGNQSGGMGINASGQIAGFVNGAFAARWTGTTAQGLSPLPTGNGAGAGYGINDSGQVAGYSLYRWTDGDNNFHQHAVVWNGTTPSDLGTLGGPDSVAYAINGLGDVVGDSGATAFLYTGGTMYNLFSLLVPGSGVTGVSFGDGNGFYGNAINDLGQIAATANYGGVAHAVLLTPTPEPTSAVLLLGVATGLLAHRRRSPASV